MNISVINAFKKRFNYIIVFIPCIILLTVGLSSFSLPQYLKYELFCDKNNLILNISPINQMAHTLTADPSNSLLLKIEARNSNGTPISYAHITFSTNIATEDDTDNIGHSYPHGFGEITAFAAGSVYPSHIRTNASGEAYVTYTPPGRIPENAGFSSPRVQINANIKDTSIIASINLSLINTPVVFIHGYQANGQIFDNLKEFLEARHINSENFEYDTSKGVQYGSELLAEYMSSLKKEYISKGIQVSKFNLISHSMGGLVARLYTCSEAYVLNNNVRKIIFMSVPHSGSALASIGMNLFDDSSMKDLIPDSELFTHIFPRVINRGVNNSIQTGNIIGQFDEVVTLNSSSLEEWGIKTEVFNVGESNLTMDNLLNGNIMNANNHKAVLNNKKVFERILDMLESEMPYPAHK